MENDSSQPITTEAVQPCLSDVISDVFERFAFMFTEPVEDGELDIETKAVLGVKILFKGPFAGSLSMFAPLSFCITLAENVLGIDADELTREHAYDAIKELVNVTCGELLVTIAGKRCVFDLSVPSIDKVETSTLNSMLKEPGVVPMLVDDEPFVLRVEIDQV